MKLRIWSVIISGVLLASLAQAQTFSHFDLSGDVSFNGATLPTAPSSSQVRGFGGQTSGTTRFNRWFGITSQFGISYLSADSISLIGYTGPGTMQHYSMMIGPRITFMSRSRFNPFVEGLAGGDRASTSLVSNGTKVTGNETQTAYAVGGGAQINVSRHFGLNFEGQYFGTQHTTAFTGWQPANFQVAAGIVIRMFGGRPQIAEGPRVSVPDISASSEPTPSPSVTPTTESPASVSTSPMNVQTVIATPSVAAPAQLPAVAVSDKQMPASVGLPAPVVVQPAVQSFASATLAPPTPQVVIPAPQVSAPIRRSTPSSVVAQPAAQSFATASVTPTAPQPAIPVPQVSVPARHPSVAAPPAVPPTTQSIATASVMPAVPQPAIPAPKVSAPVRQASVPTPTVTQRAQTVAVVPATTAGYAPTQSVARSTQAPVAAAVPSPASQTYAQPQPQAPPMSLGEYARRLREKKLQEQKQQQ